MSVSSIEAQHHHFVGDGHDHSHSDGCNCCGCSSVTKKMTTDQIIKLLNEQSNNASQQDVIEAHLSGHHSFIDETGETIDVLPYLSPEAAPTQQGSESDENEILNSLSNLPILHSDPSATVKLYLDFNGHYEANWGAYSNATTPAYSTDGDTTTFSSSELANIREIWERVSEDFAPFNVDVTTEDPGNFVAGGNLRVAIGGSSYDWYGAGAGGVAYVNSYSSFIANTVYVFTAQLANGYAKYVAEAASHEAGHAFGLRHQSQWSGNTKTAEYHPGSGNWAPIMGVSYTKNNTTWYDGKNSSAIFQDDMALIARNTNGFGYRTDDYANTNSGATTLSTTGGVVAAQGVVETNSDIDVFELNVGTGQFNVDVDVADTGANLDVVLELYDSNNNLVASANPSTLNASLSESLTAGNYFLHVKSTGTYGYVGRYDISGTVVAGSGGNNGGGPSGPEVTVTQNSTNIADGQASAINFGNVNSNTTGPSLTFTVTNDGDQTLNLGAVSLPSGYTLTEALDTTIAAGNSDTFTVQLQTNTLGTIQGQLSFTTNDSDEPIFNFNLTGTVQGTPDAYEENDTTTQVDNQTPGGLNSPNLGLLTQQTVIQNLNTLDDAEDWYKFRMNGLGTLDDFIQLDFQHSDGDLDMALYRASDMALMGYSHGVQNYEYIRLNGIGAGEYYIRVYGYQGAQNPDYTLTVNPSDSTINFNGGQGVQFQDGDGDTVLIGLLGNGNATVELSDSGDGDPNSITLNGTDDRSILVMFTGGANSATSISDVTINGSLRTFYAPTTDLTGDLNITGGAQHILLNNVSGSSQQTLTIGANANFTSGVSLRLGNVSDLTINSAIDIRRLDVQNWTDTLSPADQITAPSVQAVTSRGDFAADITMTDGNGNDIRAKMRIQGQMTGSTSYNNSADTDNNNDNPNNDSNTNDNTSNDSSFTDKDTAKIIDALRLISTNTSARGIVSFSNNIFSNTPTFSTNSNASISDNENTEAATPAKLTQLDGIQRLF